MKIGVVAEIKDQENRVALTPAGAADLVQAGHQVLVQEPRVEEPGSTITPITKIRQPSSMRSASVSAATSQSI